MMFGSRTQVPTADPRYDLCLTDDGSRTLFDHRFQATFHSWSGAVTETYHVYLKPLLESRPLPTPIPLRIFEFGLGTGLGWFLTSAWAYSTQQSLDYFAVEQFPIPIAVASELQTSLGIQAAIQTSQLPSTILPNHQHIDQLWHHWPPLANHATWHFTPTPSLNFPTTHHRLDVFIEDAAQVALPPNLDAVYFDPFDRNTSADIWTSPVLQRIYSALRPGGRMMSYSVAGEVRKALSQLGFQVQILPGPPRGKRQVLLALKPDNP